MKVDLLFALYRTLVSGSVAFVPSVAGLIIAGEVLKDLANRKCLNLQIVLNFSGKSSNFLQKNPLVQYHDCYKIDIYFVKFEDNVVVYAQNKNYLYYGNRL